MDYSKLTKEEVILLLEERNLSYNSKKSLDSLIDILVEYENSHKVSTSKDIETVGAKFSIYMGYISLVIMPILIIVFLLMIYIPGRDAFGSDTEWLIYYWTLQGCNILFIILMIGSLACIISNKNFLNGKDNRKMAAWLGIIFGGTWGGIALLTGKSSRRLDRKFNHLK